MATDQRRTDTHWNNVLRDLAAVFSSINGVQISVTSLPQAFKAAAASRWRSGVPKLTLECLKCGANLIMPADAIHEHHLQANAGAPNIKCAECPDNGPKVYNGVST